MSKVDLLKILGVIISFMLLAGSLCAQLNLSLSTTIESFESVANSETRVVGSQRYGKFALPFVVDMPDFGLMDSISLSERALRLHSSELPDSSLFLGPLVFIDQDTPLMQSPEVYMTSSDSTLVIEFMLVFEGNHTNRYQMHLQVDGTFRFHYDEPFIPTLQDNPIAPFIGISDEANWENDWFIALGEDAESPAVYTNSEIATMQAFPTQIPQNTVYSFEHIVLNINEKKQHLTQVDVEMLDNGLRIVNTGNDHLVEAVLHTLAGKKIARAERCGSLQGMCFRSNQLQEGTIYIVSMQTESGVVKRIKLRY